MKSKIQDSPTPLTLTPVDFDPFAETIEPVGFPLTEGQREIWASTQMGPEASSAYNQCYPLRIKGKLVVDAVRSAIQLLIARHEALRIVFDAQGESQTVRSALTIDIPLVDLTALGEAERNGAIAARLRQETQEPFDLVQGPLVRAHIIKEAQDCHLIVVTAHHIVCDGWSAGILLKDLTALYDADSFGMRAQMPEAGRFSDFARYQASAEYQEHATAAENYWRSQFADAVPVLDFPLDGPRPPIRTYRCDQQRLSLGEALTRDLRHVAAKHGSTLYTLLLAGYQTLIYRLTGHTDFVVGLAAAGQALIDGNALVGHGTNLLPLRTMINPEAPFSAHLRETRSKMFDALEHQAVTFGSLVRLLNLPRDPSRTPLVAATFNVDKVEVEFPFHSLTSELLASPKQFATFEIECNILDTGTDLVVECNHNLDLFSPATVRRWLTHYQVLLAGMVENPDERLGTLPLLTGAERQQLLVAWNETERIAAPGQCIHQLFEAQVERAPDAIAVVHEDQQLTYAELNARANRLAYYLRTLGVGPEVLVGLCIERSVELVVSILAILKAGGAYLPLDPSYPHERLAFMLEDAQAKFLLTQERLYKDAKGPSASSALPSLLRAPIHIISIDKVEESAPHGTAVEATNPASGVAPDNLVYVIYTSGSTGKPKGTLVSHYNVVRLFQSTAALFDFTASDTWTLFHSYAFDFSVWEIWGALLYGGKLVIVPYNVSRAPTEFATLITEQIVTVLNQTPSAFRQLLPHLIDKVPPDRLPLRYVIFGGEALELQSLQPWFEHYGDQHPALINMYGITETTVHVTYRRLLSADLHSGVGSAIGRALPDLKVYVLDPHQQLVPVGVSGELYVGGAGVARGYLSRPELTAARFIADPFSDTPGAKLYRSGDLVRWRGRGELEYLGRIDQQVKLRGFRIELGEIEAVLGQHPAVRQSAIVLREESPGDKRLVAYVVSTAGQMVTHSELQLFLRERVPEYMIPAAFVFLDALPLTANGKIDRQALPAPPLTRPELERLFVAPRTSTEETIARIWSAVLRVRPIGVYDNFFNLGGHSILAAQLVTQLRKAFGVELPLHNVFRAPTIAEFATMVEALLWANGPPQAVTNATERIEIDL